MYPVSAGYKATINQDERDWRVKVVIETAFETFEIDENDIILNSLSLKSGVISGNTFSLGGAVAADFAMTIQYEDGVYDNIQFNGGTLRPQIGLKVGEEYEWVPLGVFNIDAAEKKLKVVQKPVNTIAFQAGDNMVLLDRSFADVSIDFPCTTKTLLLAVCAKCSVTPAFSNFLNDDYIIAQRPEGDMTCRDVVSCIAEIAGCFARCDRWGRLVFDWFENPGCVEEAALDGNEDKADGGAFDWWNTPSVDGGVFLPPQPDVVLDNINRLEFTVDDERVYITGVAFETEETVLQSGSERYPIIIEDNPFIQDDPAQIVQSIYEKIKNFCYIPCTGVWRGDPAIDAGDMIQYDDVFGRSYRTVLTGYEYKLFGKSKLESAGISETAAGYRSQMTKKVSQLRRKIFEKEQKINQLDLAMQNATDLIAGALGGYNINGDDLDDPKYHGNRFICDYVGDDPSRPDVTLATKVWRQNLGGFGYSETGIDGPYIAAITSDGSIVAQVMSTQILNADMVQAGRLQSPDGLSFWDMVTGELQLSGKFQQYSSNGTKSVDVMNNQVRVYNWEENGALAGVLCALKYADTLVQGMFVGSAAGTPLRLGYLTSEGYAENCIQFSEVAGNPKIRLHPFADITMPVTVPIQTITDVNWIYLNYAAKIVFDGNMAFTASTYDNRTMLIQDGVVQIRGNLFVSGGKSRSVETSIGTIGVNAYETAECYFGDIGEGVTNETGMCVVEIDPLFAETINPSVGYHVFLQKYGSGDLWVSDRKSNHFVVQGEPDTAFSWEIKAKQKDYENVRLNKVNLDIRR